LDAPTTQVLLSFVDATDTSAAAAKAGAVSNEHLCAAGHSCLHLSNHEPTPLHAVACVLHVRSYATGASRLMEHSSADTVPAVGGAVVAAFATADLLTRAACAAGECWRS
jgi:hypothetical protein